MRIKFNDKIYRLKEIESGVDSLMELVEEQKYKNGDFVYEDERIMIVKSDPSMYHAIVWHTHSNRPCYNGTYAVDFSSPTFRYAAEEERQILIDEMRKDGKRWNADKKCIEDIPVYKDGDFVYEDGRIMIIKSYPNMYHALIYPKIDLKVSYNESYAPTTFLPELSFRAATQEEKQQMLDALANDGKRWNAGKKCVEDIPKRKFKAGDKVTLKSGCTSNPGLTYYSLFDEYIGKELIVIDYTESGNVKCNNGFRFSEDWLEPWSDEPKVGDWVIFWDSIEVARIGMLTDIRPDELEKYVVDHLIGRNHAVKWDGTVDHLQKIRSGKV